MTSIPKTLVAAPFYHLEASLAARVRGLGGGGDPLRARRVIVISRRLRDHVQRALARAGAFAGVSVQSIWALAQDITEAERAQKGLRQIPQAFAEVLAERAFERARPALAHFRTGVRGYGQSLYATLTDLAEADIPPAALRECCAALSGADAAQCADLARLAEDFWREVGAWRGYDNSALLRMACEMTEAAPPGVPTILYGFADMNALQRRLVAALCRDAECHALVPAQRGAPACAHAEPFMEWLEGLGFRSEDAGRPAPRRFSGVAGALFSGGKAARPPAGALRIVAARTRGREVLEACREMLKARAEERSEGEIGVLMTERTDYQSLFQEACQSLDIPCRTEERIPLSATPAGRLFLLMLQMPASGYPRAEVMRFLGEGDFVGSRKFRALARGRRWGAFAGGIPLASRWEYFSRGLPYLQGRDAWTAALNTALAEVGADDPERPVVRSLAAAMPVFFDLLETIPEGGPPSALARSAVAVFAETTNGLEGWEEVAERISSLAGLDEALEAVTREAFHELCKRILEKSARKGEGDGGGCLVRLSSIQSARGLSFDTLVLSGMAEGLFPSRGAEDPLLPDALREEVNRACGRALPGGGARLPLKKFREGEARFQFWTALQSVRGRLILTAPGAGEEEGGDAAPLSGRGDESASFPSMFFHYLAEAMEGGEGPGTGALARLPGRRLATATLDVADMSEAPVHLLEYDLAGILAQVHANTSAAGGLSYMNRFPGFARRRAALVGRWRRDALTEHDGVFAAPDLRAMIRERIYAPDRPIGVTSVEAFFGCPYRFLQDRLYRRMEKRAEPEPPFAAHGALRGQLEHRILERLHRWLQQTGRTLREQDISRCREALLEAVRAVMREEEERAASPPLLALPWRVLEEAIGRRLWRYVLGRRAERLVWRPVELERRFGGGGSEPIRVSLEEGEVCLSGRVDLLERSEKGGYRVVDFKTKKGKNSVPSAKKVLDGGTILQVHLYVRREAGVLPEDAEVEGAYAYITDEGVVERAHSHAEIQERREDVDALLNHFLLSVKGGEFFPTPSFECRHCDYTALCGPDRDERASGKEGAPQRSRLQKLQQKGEISRLRKDLQKKLQQRLEAKEKTP